MGLAAQALKWAAVWMQAAPPREARFAARERGMIAAGKRKLAGLEPSLAQFEEAVPLLAGWEMMIALPRA